MSLTGGLRTDGGRAVLRQARANIDAWALVLRRAPRPAGTPRLWLRSGRALAGVTITLIIIVVAALMTTADAGAIAMARALPQAARHVFEVVTDFGKSGWILCPVGVALLGLIATPAVGRINRAIVAALAVRLTFVFAAVALPGLFVNLVKGLVGRARPYVGDHVDPFLYHPFAWKAAYASLPSGHAAAAFAAAMAIGAIWPRTRPYLWTYALLIAASRIAVTAHYPSDVLIAAVIGIVGATLVRNWFAARRLAFAVDGNGRVHAMPGPSWRRCKRVASRLAVR